MSHALVYIFAGGFILALLLLQQVWIAHADTYSIRVRAKKGGGIVKEIADMPKESIILALCQYVGEFVIRVFPSIADKRTKLLLDQSNYRTEKHLAIYIGIKTLIATTFFVLPLMGAVGNKMAIPIALVLSFFSWTLPNFFLSLRVKSRKEQILHELPTVIDLLIVCAQAGLGFIMCVDKVAKEIEDSCPILYAEFKQLMNDVKIFAKPMSQALTEMGDRCGVDALINMASSLIAAESKGSDISYPLHQQADSLRDFTKRKKEEEAARLPIFMVPVIMVFIMPLVMCPMIGPAVITVMNTFSAVAKSMAH